VSFVSPTPVGGHLPLAPPTRSCGTSGGCGDSPCRPWSLWAWSGR